MVYRFKDSLPLVVLILCAFSSSAWALKDDLSISKIERFLNYSDPATPNEAQQNQPQKKVSLLNIPARIKTVKKEIALETEILKGLVPFDPTKQFDQFGYHSDYIPAIVETPEKALWTLDFDLGIKNRRILGFVMIPTIDKSTKEKKGYAFPKRFRISAINARGQPGKVYVDWTQADFPDPGMRPVFFEFPSEYKLDKNSVLRKGLRLEVFAGAEENGFEFFSLARVHMIRRGELQWARSVKASSSFESAPYWGAQYLYSSRHTLGMPLGNKINNEGNLKVELPKSKSDNPLIIRLEFDETHRINWVRLFPSRNSGGVDIPGYGFPGSVKVSRLTKVKGKRGYLRRPLDNQIEPGNPGDKIIRLFGKADNFRGLELECNDFPVYQGKPTLALGEIQLVTRENKVSNGKISVLGDIGKGIDLAPLTDGFVNGRPLISMKDWMRQLAAAKPHEQRLALLQQEYLQLTKRWGNIQRLTIISLILIGAAAAITFIFFLIHTKKQTTLRLRRQINSDLHDDIGSKIAAISLASQDVALHSSEEEIRSWGSWINNVSGTMHQALRDVLWITNNQTDSVGLLIQKLAEAARQSVPDSQLILHMPENGLLSKKIINIQTKRDILFFTKEVLHNAMCHANAETIKVNIEYEKGSLTLTVTDDGKGFNIPSREEIKKNINHLGLQTLHDRARRIGGRFGISSTIGVGTMVELSVKL